MYEPDDLTYAIIGAALAVHTELGPGLLENVYENAMCVELSRRGLRFEKQKLIPVYYKDVEVGNMFADILVEDTVIVELKSTKALAKIDEAQLIAYLKASQIKTGLLINFNVLSLKKGIKRISV